MFLLLYFLLMLFGQVQVERRVAQHVGQDVVGDEVGAVDGQKVILLGFRGQFIVGTFQREKFLLLIRELGEDGLGQGAIVTCLVHTYN